MSPEAQISSEYPFDSKYAVIDGSRMHYIEQGSGQPVLFVHGAPTWSYLWRNVIPHVAPHARAIAVDLIGMGRSDKPDIAYDFFDHAHYLEQFITQMELEDVVLVSHDWGTRYALHYAARNRDNVAGIAYSEAFVVDARWETFPDDFRTRFLSWRSRDEGWRRLVVENEFVEQVLQMGVVRKLTPEEMEQYRDPFRTESSRRMIWQFPNQHVISGEPRDVAQAVRDYHDALKSWDVPKLFFHVTPGAVYSDQVLAWVRENVNNLTVAELGEGRHFFPEDHPHAMGRALADWLLTEVC